MKAAENNGRSGEAVRRQRGKIQGKESMEETEGGGGRIDAFSLTRLQRAHLKEFAHVRNGRNEARIAGTCRTREEMGGEKRNYAGGLLPVILGAWL